jgi:hypothetical protein
MNTTEIKSHATNAMNWAASGSKLTYAAIGAGLVLFVILFRMFFKDIPGFIHCIGFSVSSQQNSAAAGQLGASRWSRIKLLLGVLLPAGTGYAAYILLPRFFPTVFPG